MHANVCAHACVCVYMTTRVCEYVCMFRDFCVSECAYVTSVCVRVTNTI